MFRQRRQRWWLDWVNHSEIATTLTPHRRDELPKPASEALTPAPGEEIERFLQEALTVGHATRRVVPMRDADRRVQILDVLGYRHPDHATVTVFATAGEAHVRARHAEEVARETIQRLLAARLHDEVLPGLAAASLLLDTERERPSPDWDRLTRVLTEATQACRSVMSQLEPSIDPPAERPDQLIRDLAEYHAATGNNPLELEVASLPPLTDGYASVLARLLGELLHNAAKHATGAPVHVSARRGQDEVRIVIADHGPGLPPGAFDSDRPQHHLGLALALARASQLGGELRLQNDVPTGCRAVLQIPLGEWVRGTGPDTNEPAG